MPDNLEPKYKVKVPKLNADKRKIDFSMSLPGFITATGVGVLALTFFFVMGILIGRGYRPEADVPPLQQIMPGAEHEAAEGKEPPKVLTTEELDYQERLQAPPQQMLDTPGPTPRPEPKPEPKPEPVKPEAKSEVTAKAEPAPAPASAPAQAPSGEPVFDYVYQVASFRKVEMAKSLNDQLAAAGLRTRIESGEAKGSTWHRVQVLHHGTPASTGDMKAVLAKFGIQKPLLKKKTAVQ